MARGLRSTLTRHPANPGLTSGLPRVTAAPSAYSARSSAATIEQDAGFGPALSQRVGKRKLNHLRWIARAHKLHHLQSPSLFQQALIDEPQFSLVQTGFEKPFVSFDITLVGIHACNSFAHKQHSN